MPFGKTLFPTRRPTPESHATRTLPGFAVRVCVCVCVCGVVCVVCVVWCVGGRGELWEKVSYPVLSYTSYCVTVPDVIMYLLMTGQFPKSPISSGFVFDSLETYVYSMEMHTYIRP